MTTDEAIAEFAAAGKTLPAAAMQWALDNWAEAAPRFLRLLDDYAEGRERSAATADALFFVLHLVGATGETRAFPALCRLLHDGEASRTVLGAAITETLRGIVIGAFDGDTVRLKGVIDDAATDDFIRDSLLVTMAYLTRTGRIAESEMRDYLIRLIEKLDIELDEPVVASWVMAVALLGYEDFVPRVEALFELPEMEYSLVTLEDFRDALQTTLADPQGMAEFERENLRPLYDPIAELAGWAGFSGEAEESPDEDLLGPAIDWPAVQTEPLLNPFRHVGRNDPCPCGSGKKFKKCCLGSGAFTLPAAQ